MANVSGVKNEHGQLMKINNLDVTKYKRFFAFGCSFTNYKWPTWADIIGKDIETYHNWGHQGAGNHFIFNSVVECDARYNFTQGDLIIIFWSTKEREDRYLNNKWTHANAHSVEQEYSKEWINKWFFDTRSQLIRDLAFIKSTQTILKSKNCDWANLSWNEFFNNSKMRDRFNTSSDKESLITLWRQNCKEVYNGNGIPDFFDDQDVIKIYQDVFTNISNVYRWFDEEQQINTTKRLDNHPTPSEALLFLDWLWPNNTISESARQYATQWDFKETIQRPYISRL